MSHDVPNPRHAAPPRRPAAALLLLLAVASCGQQPAVTGAMRQVDDHFPVDFSGSWQRNYARDDDVGRALWRAYDELARTSPDRYNSAPGMPAASPRAADALVDEARLADLITRYNALTVVQDESEIRVQREDDFSLVCRFADGRAEAVENQAGEEICGWDGNDLVSELSLTDGSRIIHRLTLSPDGQELRIITTVSSPATRTPFSLRRFFTKYDAPASEFHCIETLSMKRVCSTREIVQ